MHEKYDLELKQIINQLKKVKPKTVCIQLPDGLKPCATYISHYIEQKIKCNVLIWLGSCFGACDTPNIKADILIQWGHSRFGKLY